MCRISGLATASTWLLPKRFRRSRTGARSLGRVYGPRFYPSTLDVSDADLGGRERRLVIQYDEPIWLVRVLVSSDRPPPMVVATRVVIDGTSYPATAGIALAEGDHDIVVFVAPREAPKLQ